jgi:hypothetical protein
MTLAESVGLLTGAIIKRHLMIDSDTGYRDHPSDASQRRADNSRHVAPPSGKALLLHFPLARSNSAF